MQSGDGRNPLEGSPEEAGEIVAPRDGPPDPALRETQLFDVDLSLAAQPDIPPVPDPECVELGQGEAVFLSLKSPLKETPNEDSLDVMPIAEHRGWLVVADGLGGHRGGRRASQMVISSLRQAARNLMVAQRETSPTISHVVTVPTQGNGSPSHPDFRTVILDTIEQVNRRLIRGGTGGATTIALVEIHEGQVRTYHSGDSEVLVVSQRGRIKYDTVPHSPVGYALEAGFLTEEEALQHEDRHFVSNVVGSRQMSIELGPWIKLAPRDTVLLASDGLFDNLLKSEIVDLIRIGKLSAGVKALAKRALERMVRPQSEHPSKPDDLSILAFRGSRPLR